MVKAKQREHASENELIYENHKHIIFNGIFNCQTAVQVESCICFSRYLNYVGINHLNYQLFLKLLETNNKWVVDAVIGKREPKLLFSTIKPNFFLIKNAFDLLSYWHPKQIYEKVLHAVLGIVEYSFFKPDDGHKIYKLKLNDLNNLGKYLDESEDQDQATNRLILDILDKITKIGEYHTNIRKSILAKHAFHIRIAYFDNHKKLLNVIPQLLLVEIKREVNEIKPSSKFIQFLNNNGRK